MIQLVWLTVGFQIFICVYTIIQVVLTDFIKVVLAKYSAFKSSSKMLQEQTAAAVTNALISEKNKSRKKRWKASLCETLASRKKNLEYYETACRNAVRRQI